MLLSSARPVKNVNGQTGPYTAQTNRRVWEDTPDYLSSYGMLTKRRWGQFFPWPLHVSRHCYYKWLYMRNIHSVFQNRMLLY